MEKCILSFEQSVSCDQQLNIFQISLMFVLFLLQTLSRPTIRKMNPRAITLLITTIFACSINGDQCCAWTDVCAILDGRCCARTWCIRITFPDNPNIEPNESGFVIRPYNCTTGICEGYDDPRSSGLRYQGSNKGLSGIGR